MDYLHLAVNNDNLIKMLLNNNDLLDDKKQSEYTNVHYNIHKKFKKIS